MKSIVFYDNKCGVCNYWVNWILKNDRRSFFYFSPLKSNFSTKFSDHFRYNFPEETIVVWNDNEGFTQKSDAVIYILQVIRPNSLQLKALKIFPKPLRDIGYSIFAYFRRFVPTKTCPVLSVKDQKQFLSKESVQDFLIK